MNGNMQYVAYVISFEVFTLTATHSPQSFTSNENRKSKTDDVPETNEISNNTNERGQRMYLAPTL